MNRQIGFEGASDSAYSATAANVSHVIRRIIHGLDTPFSKDVLLEGALLIEEFLIEHEENFEPSRSDIKPSFETLHKYCVAESIIDEFQKSRNHPTMSNALNQLRDLLNEWALNNNKIKDDKNIAEFIAEFFMKLSRKIEQKNTVNDLIRKRLFEEGKYFGFV